MANPFPFVSGAVLQAAELNGIGEYVAYTPTWGNLTVGNGTATFRYGRVQDLIHVHGKLLFGSTTSVTGNVTMALPVTAGDHAVNAILGDTRLGDAGVGTSFGLVILATTTTVALQAFNASATYLTNTAFTSTVPFTWSTNDEIYVNFIYEV
jgi:putative exporter of polyketide antibiotics